MPEPVLSIRKWSCSSRTLGDDMFAARWTRCLLLNSYLIDRYFSVHLTTNIGDVKLSTNVVYGRNGLRPRDWLLFSNPSCKKLTSECYYVLMNYYILKTTFKCSLKCHVQRDKLLFCLFMLLLFMSG